MPSVLASAMATGEFDGTPVPPAAASAVVSAGSSEHGAGRRARLRRKTVDRWERVKKKILALEHGQEDETADVEHWKSHDDDSDTLDSGPLRMKKSTSFSGLPGKVSSPSLTRPEASGDRATKEWSRSTLNSGEPERYLHQMSPHLKSHPRTENTPGTLDMDPSSSSSTRLPLDSRADISRRRNLRVSHRSRCMSESELTHLVTKANEDAVDIDRMIYSPTLCSFVRVPADTKAQVD
ncbi:hypothetical protein FVE85_0649 [Porphyridium purpureum]|uniref:Uncharacterized protein n=1 Tax=Porphyridium purpureum TaxID=35688 RepID=A0A5J4Z0X6_PORPP|nr:hypothetical protein FVE85_0649 [Porphyridium purpureum]|eukprot:POR6399..scf208_2